MADYDPERPPYDDRMLEPSAPSRAFYLVVGLIAAIVALAGLLFLSGPIDGRTELARTPEPASLDVPARP